MEFRRGKMKSVLYVLLITISSTLFIIVSHLAFVLWCNGRSIK